jgi:plasmid stabilization system protein ParE
VPDFLITEQAQSDLEAIDEYITADNPRAADLLIDDLYSAMQRAADDPEHAGTIRDDLTDRNVRFMLVRKNYWLIYTAASATRVVIVRVLHARRDIPNIL